MLKGKERGNRRSNEIAIVRAIVNGTRSTHVISEEVVGLGRFSSSGATPRSQRSHEKDEEGRGKTRWPKVGECGRRCSSRATLRIDSLDTWTSLL